MTGLVRRHERHEGPSELIINTGTILLFCIFLVSLTKRFRVTPSPSLRSSLRECKQARKETSSCPICVLLKPLNEACSIVWLSLSYLRLRAFVPALYGSSQQRQTRVRFPFSRASVQP
ncbi:hypothetical protein BDV09DRAFT_123318 [Aspergillus tetrazonus]